MQQVCILPASVELKETQSKGFMSQYHMLAADHNYITAGTSGNRSSDAGNVIGADTKRERGAHQTFIQVEDLQKPLCGQSRPHFFRGVATVCYLMPVSALLHASTVSQPASL